jgi:DNA topoisomerase-1
MNLVIVESPTKSKTIKKFLGKDFKVVATYGHIRDLPRTSFGIDVENNFKPKYLILPRARKVVKFLMEEAKNSSSVILATDLDREGEAISWHLVELLGLNGKKPYKRIVFHEITKEAIEEALKSPRKIDMNLVNAQQARRILDRIVGYKLSPFLWKKIAKGLSAGRVQSVALRLIVEREREIENFVPQEYWTIEAIFKKIQEPSSLEIEAQLIKKEGKPIPKMGIKTKKEAEEIVNDLKGGEYKIERIEKKEIKKLPLPPFVTSSLQREAWQKFHWPAKMTMNIAQQLYERGLISYHRTDSFNLSLNSLQMAKDFIIKNYGESYWAGGFRQFKRKAKGAQEAHEAIRPVSPFITPQDPKEKLERNQKKLYELIWRRFIASQMKEAVFDSTVLDISAKGRSSSYLFESRGQILKFDGFLKVYPINYEEKILPSVNENEPLKLLKLIPLKHLTKPPSRYNDASLIKELEKYGIGRPSTYAPILSTIQERNYVKKINKQFFYPTEIGNLVNDLLVKHFPEVVDINFTAKMEEDLDKIAQAQKDWREVIKEFYDPFIKNLEEKEKEVDKKDVFFEKTDKKCPVCQKPLVVKISRFGKFYACSDFPRCKYKEKYEEGDISKKN